MNSVIKKDDTSIYILNSFSPIKLKYDYDIVLQSIRNDVDSANYVEWDLIDDSQKVNNLIQEVIKNGYELSEKSCRFLQENVDVALNSIKRNPNTKYYMDFSVWNHPKMIKYLVQNGYKFDISELRKMPLIVLYDDEIMRYITDKHDIFDICDVLEDYPKSAKKYKERFIQLFINALSSFPKIANFASRMQYITELFWKENREDNINDYANIFGKICTELKNNQNHHNACANLTFLNKMRKVLGDKYDLLLDAMREYHTIIHSGDKLDNIDRSRDLIASLSALYISSSKEKYKKKILENFYRGLRLYYLPRVNHPVVKKKIIEHKQRKNLVKLFESGDSNLINFLEKIVDEWKDSLDKDTIRHLIETFIIDNCSKLEKIIDEPDGFNDYKRNKLLCKCKKW